VLGDFNAFEFNDGYVDAMNVVTGTPTPDNQTAVAGDGVDLVDPDLMNLFVEEPADQRYSFVFDGNAQSLDHVLINQALGVAVGGFDLDHARINADFPEVMRNNANSPSRLSDHDPAIAYFAVSSADLAATASAAPASVAQGATMSFNATVTNHGPDAAAFPGVGFAFDAELADLEMSAPAGWTCDTPTIGASTVVACSAATLANAASAAFQLTATAPPSAAGNAINMAVLATAQTQDTNEDNNDAEASVNVIGVADLHWQLFAQPEPIRFEDGYGLFTAILTNTGPDAAAGAEVTIKLNVPSSDVSGILANVSAWQCTRADTVTFQAHCINTGRIEEAGTVSFFVNHLRPFRQTAVTFSASVTSDAIDPNPGDNSARKIVRILGFKSPTFPPRP
jgi:hypothetical protein